LRKGIDMSFNDLLFMNDWEIGKFLRAIMVIQVIMLVTIALDVMDLGSLKLGISIVRQVMGFIYLTFVPGIILLRILRLHQLDPIQNTLYCVGLSTGFLMFIGLLMNILYPIFGVLKPISASPLITTVSIVVLLLCIFSYLRDKSFVKHDHTITEKISSSPILVIVLIPLMSIFGVLLVNSYGTNIILLLLLVTIPLIVTLAVFGRFIPTRLYPLVIIAIAVALLYHFSLISQYVVGWDMHLEYYFYRMVETKSIWNPAIPDSYNSALSVVMLPVVYSQVMNMDGNWIFKIIYPFIYSLVPLGLFEVYRRQTNAKIAFLSVFFFMSLYTFFNEMPSLARQETAVFFIVLLMLLMLDKKMQPRKRALLSLFFSASLVISHYGVSYLYMLYLVIAWIFWYALGNSTATRFWRSLRASLEGIVGTRRPESQNNTTKSDFRIVTMRKKTITATSAIFLFIFALTWYIYVSSSAPFESVVSIGSRIYNGIVSEFFVAWARDPLILRAFGIGSGIIQRQNFRIVQYVTQFFIIVGVIRFVMRYKETRFDWEYGAMTLTSTVIIAMSVVLPYFASSLNMSRIYHFTLIFLAPFCVLGGETIFTEFLNLSKSRLSQKNKETCVTLLISIVLITYFLFNTGFFYEVTGDIPSSVSLSMERMKISDETEVKVWFQSMIVSQQDVLSATWLSKTRNATFKVYADFISGHHVLRSYGLISKNKIYMLSNNIEIDEMTYIYLSHLNIIDGVMTGPESYTEPWKADDVSPLLEQRNKVYSNGFSEIYCEE